MWIAIFLSQKERYDNLFLNGQIFSLIVSKKKNVFAVKYLNQLLAKFI